MKILKDDNYELWLEVMGHVVEMPDDWEGEHALYCKKCGLEAVMNKQMLWICPLLLKIPSEYFHPG